MNNKYWILVCNIKRYDIHTLFKDQGYCLWNQRRDFQIGDILYIYETKPASKFIYKAVVEEINVKRDVPENADGFYNKEYNKEYAFKMRCVATNPGNRLQFKEIFEKFGFSSMSLLRIPQIKDEEVIKYFEEVFAGKVEDLPAPLLIEVPYQPLESGDMLEHIKHKMEFCKIRNSHLAKLTGISGSSISRARKGEKIKADCVLEILDALDFAFVDCSNEKQVYNALEIVSVIRDKIVSSGMRTGDIAKSCDAAISVISHLKHDGATPKLEVLQKLLDTFNLKVVSKK